MITRRTFGKGLLAASALSMPALKLQAQAAPLRVGFSIAQTGGLAAGGKSGLLAFEIWRDHVNAAGGIAGRPVELVVYDDQTNASSTPAIYSKLIDIDKVDILLSPYGTNVAGPTIPIAKERGRVIFGMAAIGLNQALGYDRYFSMGPWGPDPKLTYQYFFDLVRQKGLKKIAIIAADAEFQQNAADGGRQLIEQHGLELVYDQSYPANTTDFSGLLQALQQAAPEVVYVCSYPPESAAIVRGIDEIGLPDSIQMFGGGMVGLQNANFLESLGSQLNGIVNYDIFSIQPNMIQAGANEFLAAYAERAAEAKVDPLGHFLPPYWYAAGQVIKAAVEATGGVDDAKLAEWLHGNEVPTIVGPIRFGQNGEWSENRVLMVQYQGVASGDVEQFRKPGKVAIVAPEKFKTADLVTPFAAARG